MIRNIKHYLLQLLIICSLVVAMIATRHDNIRLIITVFSTVFYIFVVIFAPSSTNNLR